jgi:Tol biopolymer transport system component
MMESIFATVVWLIAVGLLRTGLIPGGPTEGRDATALAAPDTIRRPVVHRVFDGGDLGDFAGASLSPDGRYVITTSGGGPVGMLDLITGERRGVTPVRDDSSTWSNGWTERARFSPDGSRIAISWFSYACDCYEIHVANADGSTSRLLMRSDSLRSQSGWWPDIHGWSPDGDSLVVTFWRRGRADISLVSVTNATRRVLQTTDGRGPNFAALSPDGRLVAYDLDQGRTGGASDVFVMPVAGGTPRLVVGGPSQDLPLGWAPDGSLLVYSDRELTEGVWRLPFRDGHPSGDLELLRGGLWGMQPMSVSGSRFAYGLRTGARQVHLTSIDLERNRIGTTYTPIEETLRASTSPAWSADGRWLAYTTNEWKRGGGSVRRLIVQPLAGGDPREIAPEGLEGIRFPTWTNGDRTLVVLARRSDGEEGHFAIDLETGRAALVGPRRDDFIAAGLHPSAFTRELRGWMSPDARTFYARGADSQIYAFDLTDLQHGRVLASFEEPVMGQLSVSPAGDRIAVWTVSTLWAVETRTGEKTALSHRSRIDYRTLKTARCGGRLDPQWTSDGRSLLIQRSEVIPRSAAFGPTPCQVYKIPVTGGEPVPVGAVHTNLTWALHPDGTRLALEYGQNRSEVWIMEDLPGSR